jgi:D-alanine-D-alanine ligase
MKKVLVLMGGWSAEREVSLVSGHAVSAALKERGYDVTDFDLRKGGVPRLIQRLDPAPDAVFNALHGRFGEDGAVQGLLDLLEIPYTHSGLLASALAMHKPTAKRLFAASGLRCPEGRTIERAELSRGDPMARPYVVKPANEGSSVGVHIVRAGDNRPPLDEDAGGGEIMIERFIEGRELTVAVMGARALAVTELRPKQGFYDYSAKYTAGLTEHLIPAPVPAGVHETAMAMACEAHRTLGCRGLSRADLRYDERAGGSMGLYLLEVNTQPGMTPLSLVPEQAAHVGIPFAELVSWMVEHARWGA